MSKVIVAWEVEEIKLLIEKKSLTSSVVLEAINRLWLMDDNLFVTQFVMDIKHLEPLIIELVDQALCDWLTDQDSMKRTFAKFHIEKPLTEFALKTCQNILSNGNFEHSMNVLMIIECDLMAIQTLNTQLRETLAKSPDADIINKINELLK